MPCRSRAIARREGRLRWTPRRGVRAAEGARLEIAYVVKAASRVQIPPSPCRAGERHRSPALFQQLCVCAAASAGVGPTSPRSDELELGSTSMFAEAGISGLNWIEYHGFFARTNRLERTHQSRA